MWEIGTEHARKHLGEPWRPNIVKGLCMHRCSWVGTIVVSPYYSMLEDNKVGWERLVWASRGPLGCRGPTTYYTRVQLGWERRPRAAIAIVQSSRVGTLPYSSKG